MARRPSTAREVVHEAVGSEAKVVEPGDPVCDHGRRRVVDSTSSEAKMIVKIERRNGFEAACLWSEEGPAARRGSGRRQNGILVTGETRNARCVYTEPWVKPWSTVCRAFEARQNTEHAAACC